MLKFYGRFKVCSIIISLPFTDQSFCFGNVYRKSRLLELLIKNIDFFFCSNTLLQIWTSMRTAQSPHLIMSTLAYEGERGTLLSIRRLVLDVIWSIWKFTANFFPSVLITSLVIKYIKDSYFFLLVLLNRF